MMLLIVALLFTTALSELVPGQEYLPPNFGPPLIANDDLRFTDFQPPSNDNYQTISDNSLRENEVSSGPSGRSRDEKQSWKSSVPGVPGQDYPDLKEIPETSFSCADKVPGGYYADVETRCQVFHVCTLVERKNSFLCPPGSIFNQKFFVCDWWYDFNCEDALSLYSLNDERIPQPRKSGKGASIGLKAPDEFQGGSNSLSDNADLSLSSTGEGGAGYASPGNNNNKPDSASVEEQYNGADELSTTSSADDEQANKGETPSGFPGRGFEASDNRKGGIDNVYLPSADDNQSGSKETTKSTPNRFNQNQLPNNDDNPPVGIPNHRSEYHEVDPRSGFSLTVVPSNPGSRHKESSHLDESDNNVDDSLDGKSNRDYLPPTREQEFGSGYSNHIRGNNNNNNGDISNSYDGKNQQPVTFGLGRERNGNSRPDLRNSYLTPREKDNNNNNNNNNDGDTSFIKGPTSGDTSSDSRPTLTRDDSSTEYTRPQLGVTYLRPNNGDNANQCQGSYHSYQDNKQGTMGFQRNGDSSQFPYNQRPPMGRQPDRTYLTPKNNDDISRFAGFSQPDLSIFSDSNGILDPELNLLLADKPPLPLDDSFQPSYGGIIEQMSAGRAADGVKDGYPSSNRQLPGSNAIAGRVPAVNNFRSLSMSDFAPELLNPSAYNDNNPSALPQFEARSFYEEYDDNKSLQQSNGGSTSSGTKTPGQVTSFQVRSGDDSSRQNNNNYEGNGFATYGVPFAPRQSKEQRQSYLPPTK